MEYIFLILRVLLIFMSIMIIIRILGKREVGELSIFDLVVLLLIADLGSIGIDEPSKLGISIISLVLLLLLQKFFSLLLIKVSKLRTLFDGDPTIIIQNGFINMRAMKKEMYSIDDLITQIREKKIMDLSEISLAILETNGTLSVFRKEKYQDTRLPIVLSGKICKENLEFFGLEEENINKFFQKHRLRLKNIIYASYDKKDVFYYENSTNRELLGLKTLSWKRQNQDRD